MAARNVRQMTGSGLPSTVKGSGFSFGISNKLWLRLYHAFCGCLFLELRCSRSDVRGEPSPVTLQTTEPAEPELASLQGRERRESERLISYWEKKAALLGGDLGLAALDLTKMRSSEWSHRFVIAVDPAPENSALLYYGADFARLLELPGRRTPHVPITRLLRDRFLSMFKPSRSNNP